MKLHITCTSFVLFYWCEFLFTINDTKIGLMIWTLSSRGQWRAAFWMKALMKGQLLSISLIWCFILKDTYLRKPNPSRTCSFPCILHSLRLCMCVYSTLKDIYLHNPNVRWEDIIGLEDAKRLVKEAVVYPIKVRPPHDCAGILVSVPRLRLWIHLL